MLAHDYFDSQFPEPGADATPPTTTPPSPPERGRRALAAGVVALALIGGAGSGALSASLFSHKASTASTATTGSTTSTVTTAANAPDAASNAAAVYQAVSPGVVTITSDVTGRFGQQGQATGSGIVLDTRGDILTNDHVIAGASHVSVTLSNGTTANATIIGTNSGDDLAVIRIAASAQLHPVTLGDSGTVQIGDAVYAIGSPFGLSGTLTQGIVSGLNRQESSTTSSGNLGSSLNSLIQTDTPINPGNSGGPLVNSQGAVVGVNQSIESPVDGNVGVGFAIPINLVKQLLPSLEAGSNV